MKTTVHSYKDLIVWQKAMDLVIEVYQLTKSFPKTEQFCLISQMRRSAISIPSNIAEGRLRHSKADYMHFLVIAYSSGAELETQIEIAKRLRYLELSKFEIVDSLVLEVMKMLNSMVNRPN